VSSIDNITIYTELVDHLWSANNSNVQESLLREFAKTMRICDAEYLIKMKAFPVINNQIIANILEEINCNDLVATGLYQPTGRCTFLGRLVIPLRGFDNQVHGFVGYDNGNECKSEEEKLMLIPYLYLADNYFKKERYWFMNRDEYLNALENQYICIVDGIFDKITLQTLGHPATSLLGSNISKYHRDYLRYIKNWIVFSDSDIAGTQLYKTCKKFNPNTIQIRVGNGAKDVDERLRNDNSAQKYLNRLFDTLKDEKFIFNHSLEEFVSENGH
jgi:DNA primase